MRIPFLGTPQTPGMVYPPWFTAVQLVSGKSEETGGGQQEAYRGDQRGLTRPQPLEVSLGDPGKKTADEGK